jgi:hypothetical protein
VIIERSQKKVLTQRVESEPRQYIQVLYGVMKENLHNECDIGEVAGKENW